MAFFRSILNGFHKVRRYFSVYVIQRKVVIVGIMAFAWLALLLGAVFSPQRVVYTQAQLDTHQEFGNGTGSVDLVSQQYSKSNGLMVLNFETTDATSSVSAGIDADQLRWKLYMKDKASKTSMEVLPTVDNKISVILRHVPKDFDAIAIEIDNKTVDTSEINVDSITDTSSSSSSSQKQKPANDSEARAVQFMVVRTSDSLKRVKLRNLSRKDFAKESLHQEIETQAKVKIGLQNSIKQFKQSIRNSQNQKKQLEAKGAYLVGQDKTDNESSIQTVDNDIQTKNESVTDAQAKVQEVTQRIKALKKKLSDVDSGKFKYGTTVKEVKMK